MPKDSKNGFYRQEQNIGRLISPFCVCIFTARSPPRPMVVHAAPWRFATAVRGLASRPIAVRTARVPSPCASPVPRCGRARCPHRAAAPRRGARLGIPRPLFAPPVRPRRASSFTP